MEEIAKQRKHHGIMHCLAFLSADAAGVACRAKSSTKARSKTRRPAPVPIALDLLLEVQAIPVCLLLRSAAQASTLGRPIYIRVKVKCL